ncbi:hypothetical protein B0J18DRAFT_276635 [Chaetomium sp. MPI-SDFR-AT-0129]|nr:hypothetical protein B0J18DRAFT_276635 [Chaetomium sp. MPI-SDFR-AT-0129]
MEIQWAWVRKVTSEPAGCGPLSHPLTAPTGGHMPRCPSIHARPFRLPLGETWGRPPWVLPAAVLNQRLPRWLGLLWRGVLCPCPFVLLYTTFQARYDLRRNRNMLAARSYSKVQERDSLELSDETHAPQPSQGDSPSKRQSRALQCLLGFSLLANIALTLLYFSPWAAKQAVSGAAEDECRHLRSFEDVYEDVPSVVQCSTVRFDTGPGPSGSPDFKTFWGRHWFEGSEDDINLLWRQLSSVQLLSITAQEASRLPAHTARDADTPGKFAVTPQVFHDMHCLNYVRNHALGIPQMYSRMWTCMYISWETDRQRQDAMISQATPVFHKQ